MRSRRVVEVRRPTTGRALSEPMSRCLSASGSEPGHVMMKQMDTDEDALAQVGTTIAEKYRLLSLLGAGGMGAVYEAEHVFTKRRVALKRMLPGLARSKHAADRFIREARAPSTIGHPGIVQVLDGGFAEDGSLYLVLELLEGVSMQDALAQHALEVPAILQIGIELLQALGAAHAKGFIHRDIKPDNVFLAHDGRDSVSVKLLDFGIASVRESEGVTKLTRTGSVLGTPHYMSPEQAQGAPIDARSDLWSVGAMLYRALAGKAPYHGDTYNALIVSIVTKKHAPLSESRPDLPGTLLEIVERAMQKAPSDRFDTAAQMCSALQAVSLDARPSAPGLTRASLRVPVAAAPASAAHSGASRLATRAGQPAPRAPRGTTQRMSEAHDGTRSSAVWRIVAAAAGVCLVASAIGAFALRDTSRDASGQLSAAHDRVPAETTKPEPAPSASITVDPTQKAEPQLAVAADDTAPKQAEQGKAAESRAPAQGLSRDVLMRVLQQKERDFQRCLEDAVVAQMLVGAAKPAPLRLDVELRIASSGRVEQAVVQGQAPQDLARCLRAHLDATQFPSAAAPTQFRYPLVLAATIVGE